MGEGYKKHSQCITVPLHLFSPTGYAPIGPRDGPPLSGTINVYSLVRMQYNIFNRAKQFRGAECLGE